MPASKVNCKCCNKLSEAHLAVTCSVCKDRFKNTCVDISANEVRTLNSNKGYDWTCGDCRTVGKDLKDLMALIINLQNDIKELKAEKNSSKNNFTLDFEEIVTEVSERQKRKNNIVFFNVAEQDQSVPSTERQNKDKSEVINVITIVDPEISISNIKPIRLGPFITGKTRPLKITVENEDIVKKILKNSKKVKSNQKYKNTILSADRTPKQMEYYKKVKQELNDRIAAGETNCKIKYVNNIPKIVSEN